MNEPVEPILKKGFFIARNLRWIFFFVLILGIGFLFYKYGSILGLALTALTALLWYIEIVRGNDAEDRLLKDMKEDSPLK